MSMEWEYRSLNLRIDLKECTKEQLQSMYDLFYNINYDVCKAIEQWEEYCKDNNIEIPH